MDDRKLYRSNTDKAIFGVCGGIAEYFGVDSLIVRLLFVLVSFGYGSGLLVYLIAALVIPKKPEGTSEFSAYANARNPQARYDGTGSGTYTRVNPVFAGDAESAARIKRAAQKEMDEAMAAAEQAAMNVQAAKVAAEAAGKELEEDAEYIKAMAASTAAFDAYREAADKAERVFRGDAASVEEAEAQIKAEAEKARAEAASEGAQSSGDTGRNAQSSASADPGPQSSGSTSQSYSYQRNYNASQSQAPRQDKSGSAGSKLRGTIGVALLAIGVMWILQRFFRHLPVIAIVLIIVGIYILFTKDK